MRSREAARLGTWAAGVAAAGIVLSGPVALIVVSALAPQPPWQGAGVFAAHYHPIQLLPYVPGFALVGGFVGLHAALVEAAPPRTRANAIAALAFATVFAAMIGFNYVAQLAVVPNLRDDPAAASLVSALTMSNPSSVCWSLEMFGYGVLGVASIFAAPCFAGPGLERTAAVLLWANGGVSIVGAGMTAVAPTWVQSTPGLVAYAAWNALAHALVIVIAIVFRRASRA